MSDFIRESVYLGVVISVGSYVLGAWMKKRWKLAIFHPLLISVTVTIAFLALTKTDYDTYMDGARYIQFFLTPATVCLAVPLYEQFHLLKKNALAIVTGILAGTLAGLVSIWLLCLVLGLDHAMYVTLLPKSITTAIAMGVSEELGGYVSLTVATVIITGISGNIFASGACRLFRITDPIARGVAIGTSAHAIGTARAMELGETEGAMSGLSIVVAGVFTVVGAALFARLL